ncbi:MAG: uroporphyrinogen-III C-methyltransferase [Chromatiales bacterium]|jgi:uroporphyrin-III C-methyltransferase/precorrin-2 dehydrogenase/sirohydrochlorin ferrochelatase/uroporphyrin-III C-methyltransferase|nr:uroporphyrinogen-III C-methyltransferase [Chromatiales bacterium]MDX9767290.1 uroporphyrinogen-III C-methyltransferase [Ectothiorhodospiraceae bacterium]
MREFGKVHLVGAGPGDPELLTIKALRLLERADVVVYDRLVSDAVLDLIPGGVTRIDVGKASGRHGMPQRQINELLVSLARKRRQVVRLKGGDPFIFGRGSEEALHLRRHGIPFEVVPGITAATACSAYAGVPLTHRGMSRGVRLVTGHFRDDEPIDLDWRALADPEATLVVYMGLSNLARITTGLLDAGMAPDTPAMAVQDGTMSAQRRVFADLRHLPQRVQEAGLGAPLLIIIGRTVALAGELDWYLSDEEAQRVASDRSVCA